MQVEVSDKLGGRRECYLTEASTVRDIILESVPDWEQETCLPFSIYLDGEPANDLDAPLTCNKVEMVIEPRGAGTLAIISAIVSIASTAYTLLVANKIPDNFQQTAEPGQSLYRAGARGNFARLWANVPELFGETRRYPDLIAPIWREFKRTSDGRYVEVAHMLACVGVGNYETVDWRIGETSVGSYPANILINQYDPGVSLGNDPGNVCMYTAPEVGASSSGGLEIRKRGEPVEYTYDFEGKCITAYVNGAPAAFPFALNEIFNYGRFQYLVTNIEGANDEKATVERCVGISSQARRLSFR